jgi:hypothetical protein
MSQRTFQFRLFSSHAAPDRVTASLVVEFLAESGEWQPQTPSLTTPRFRLYRLSLLLCQYYCLVANAQEQASLCSRWKARSQWSPAPSGSSSRCVESSS